MRQRPLSAWIVIDVLYPKAVPVSVLEHAQHIVARYYFEVVRVQSTALLVQRAGWVVQEVRACKAHTWQMHTDLVFSAEEPLCVQGRIGMLCYGAVADTSWLCINS
jgi:hypothetical protein